MFDKLNIFFIEYVFSKFFFFSVIIIEFLELILLLSKFEFTNVSRVFPDFEIIIKQLFLNFIFFFTRFSLVESKLSMKIKFFFYFFF